MPLTIQAIEGKTTQGHIVSTTTHEALKRSAAEMRETAGHVGAEITDSNNRSQWQSVQNQRENATEENSDEEHEHSVM